MTNYIQVITTTASRDDAHRIAQTLVEKRLAGCVQIVGPITSVYRWEGRIEQAEEWQCIIKSRQDLFDALADAIWAGHPYDVPEILAVPVIAGSKDYLAWLETEIIPSEQDRLPGM
jgi:periplasmic divalent cation tolerance protein